MYAVEMHGITKQFKNVLANSNVELMVKRGEIHSLLGENGAGKSTLMNILYGMYAPTSGQIIVQGQPVVIENPLKAISLGIAMVHQHFMLIEPLTVAENVVLGYEPKKRGCFDMKKAVEEVNTLADQYGLHVDAHEKVENLSVGTKQRVEILKALYRKADILILDEPTAVLTPQEVSDLFRVLRKLKESGKTIIIITHKLKETLELADTVTVLRKGQVISSLPVTKEMDQAQLAELMVGRIVSLETEKKPVPGEHEVVMALQNATLTRDKRNLLDDVNLEIRSGEILGISGIAGSGQRESCWKPTSATSRRIAASAALCRASPLLKTSSWVIIATSPSQSTASSTARRATNLQTAWPSSTMCAWIPSMIPSVRFRAATSRR